MFTTKLLAGIDPLEQGDILARLTEGQTFDKGEAIVLKGDPGTALFVIRTGQAQIKLGRFVQTFEPGEFLGELSFLDGEPRSAKITATADNTQVLFLARARIDEQAQSWPQLVATIYRNIGITLAQRLRQTNEHLRTLPAQERSTLLTSMPWLARLLGGTAA